ncbi:hypothetical protein BCR44DRAFT_1423088, partial [Catenaria anguillulae PL171]
MPCGAGRIDSRGSVLELAAALPMLFQPPIQHTHKPLGTGLVHCMLRVFKIQHTLLLDTPRENVHVAKLARNVHDAIHIGVNDGLASRASTPSLSPPFKQVQVACLRGNRQGVERVLQRPRERVHGAHCVEQPQAAQPEGDVEIDPREAHEGGARGRGNRGAKICVEVGADASGHVVVCLEDGGKVAQGEDERGVAQLVGQSEGGRVLGHVRGHFTSVGVCCFHCNREPVTVSNIAARPRADGEV